MDKSFEEILREKMNTPVALKNQPGVTIMPLEAMAMSVMNSAMKGDIPSIAFINNLIQKRGEDTPEYRAKQEELFRKKCEELRKDLEADGLWHGQQMELELIAHQAMMIDRVAELMQREGHADLEEKTLKDGTRAVQISATNRVFLDLTDKFRKDLQALWVRARTKQQISRRHNRL